MQQTNLILFSMAKVYYKLSSKVQPNGKSNIIVWFRASRTLQVQLQTNIQVLPKHFEVAGKTGGTSYGTIKVPNKSKLNFVEVKEATEAKTRLQDYTNKLLKVCEVVTDGELTKQMIIEAVKVFDVLSVQDITKSTIEEAQQAKEQKEAQAERKGFFDYADLYLAENKFAESRYHSFMVLMRTLHRWQAYRQAIEPRQHFVINLDTMTADDVQDFREYVRNEYELQNEQPKLFAKLLSDYPVELTPKHKHAEVEQRGENTVIKFMKFFKTYWIWLMVQKGATTNNPFIKVQIGSAVYGVPYYLTIEERNKIAEFDLSHRPQLAVQRDIFVFQCLIGCRVSDLIKLTDANITNGILEYVPIKTKNNAEQVKPRIPLNDRAKALIEQYKGKDSKGRLFPYISTQKYNEAIKEVLKVCGIDRNVQVRNSITGNTDIRPIYEVASSHMARRTFVGTAYSKVQDPNLIGKMSGHVEGSRAFARYRAIDDDLLKNVINLID